MNRIWTWSIVLWISGINAWADHPSLTFSGSSGAVNTISAQTMKNGKFALGLRSEYISNNTLSDEVLEKSVNAGVDDVHSIDSLSVNSFSIVYGVTDALMLNLNIPYIQRDNIRSGEEEFGVAEVDNHGDSEGLSDVTALLQNKIYDADEMQFSLLYGLKIPTGKTDISDEDELLELHLQPGSGSWDLLTGIVFSKHFNALTLHSNILYQYTTKGEQDTTLGTLFNYNMALSYKVIPLGEFEMHTHNPSPRDTFYFGLDIFTELNGEYRTKDTISNEKDENSGGHVLNSTLGARLLTNKGFSSFLAISVSLIENLNGIQNKNDYKLIFGVGVSF